MKILVIVGPTATGKTRLGVEVAHAIGSEIISADSRQVYRGLDIGTGKDLGEYSAVDPPVPYHLIDIVDPEEVYSLFRYQQDCFKALRKLARRRKIADGTTPLLMVGGSGLYIEAILRGFQLADVAEDHQLRCDLQGSSREDLEARLLNQAPDIHQRTDCSSNRRQIRGLEIAAAEKRGPVHFTQPLEFELDVRILSISTDRRKLRTQIAERLKMRLKTGMIEEVRGLLSRGITPQRLEKLGLEYREISAYLAGRKTYRSMVSDLENAIGKFAKRQETWFRGMPRRDLSVRTIDGDDTRAALETLELW